MAKNFPVLLDIGEGLSIMVGLPTIASWRTQNRPNNSRPGTFGFNTESKRLEYFDGTDWYAIPMGSA